MAMDGSRAKEYLPNIACHVACLLGIGILKRIFFFLGRFCPSFFENFLKFYSFFFFFFFLKKLQYESISVYLKKKIHKRFNRS